MDNPDRHNKEGFALRPVLLLALGAALFAASSLTLSWRLIRDESVGFMQQSIGDIAQTLALFTRAELEHVTAEILQGSPVGPDSDILEVQRIAIQSIGSLPPLQR